MRASLSPLFWFGLLVSFLLHLLATFSDTLWLWWQTDRMDESIISASQRKLKSQTLTPSTTKASQAHLPDKLTITFRAPAPTQIPTHAVAATASPAHNKHLPKHHKKAIHSQISVPTPLNSNIKEQPASSREELNTPPSTSPPVADNMPPDTLKTDIEIPPANQETSTKTPNPSTPTQQAVEAERPVLNNTFPDKVDIQYAAKGLVLVEHHWRLNGNRYVIDTKGSLFSKAIEWHSEGEIDQHGLKPTYFKEYRDNLPTPKYVVDFDWANKKVHYGEPGQQKEAELQMGAQDAFSAAYQFALQGDKLSNFNMQIVTGRNSYFMPFELKGETKLSLSGYSVTALVLLGVNQQKRFSFYLAPDWHNLPVRIEFNDDGKVTDLIAISIKVNDEVLLSRINH